MAPRIILRIELTPIAKQHLENLSAVQGMTQLAMLSRVIEWFARQPEVLQRIIVGHIPRNIERDVAKLMLRSMAKGQKTTSSRGGQLSRLASEAELDSEASAVK
jgi:hypothetical protein